MEKEKYFEQRGRTYKILFILATIILAASVIFFLIEIAQASEAANDQYLGENYYVKLAWSNFTERAGFSLILFIGCEIIAILEDIRDNTSVKTKAKAKRIVEGPESEDYGHELDEEKED